MASKKNKKNTKVTTSQLNTEFTITFANNEQYNILEYNPNKRCAPIRDTNGKRDFVNKSSSGGSSGGTYTPLGVDTSRITSKNCKKIADRLLTKSTSSGDKLNVVQLIGILANICEESQYSSSATTKLPDPVPRPEDYQTKYAIGLFQWEDERAEAMKSACGSKWASKLIKQTDFIWTELTGIRINVLTSLLNVTKVNKKAAYTCMEIVCKGYKTVNNYNTEVAKRKKVVDVLWKQLKPTDFRTTGNKNHNLTDEQIRRLVAGCIQENGSSKQAIQAEASLMCNLAESYRGAKFGYNVYKYVNRWHRDGGWFGDDTIKKIRGNGYKSISTTQYNYGYEVFNGGLRTAPNYIDEHDWFPNDIVWIKYNGESDSKSYRGFNRNKLISGKSIIHNNSNSTYTFWMFMQPNNQGDPYGSTYHPKKYSGK